MDWKGGCSPSVFTTLASGALSLGPMVAFLLVGEIAIARLQCLAGDIDPAVTKLKDPKSFISVYGQT